MKSPVAEMLETYRCSTPLEYRNALKEIIQEIALLGLSRAGFFNTAAFYGGTALRIFHGLDRFSEDLDFTLIEPDSSFDLEAFLPAVRDELGAWGFEMTVDRKQKTEYSPVQSAFIKGGTLIHLVKIASITPPISGVPANEVLRVKFEVDTDPPDDAEFEVKYRLQPIPFSVRLYDPPSLFAGKLHALLCRTWNSRVKGRDYYDYLWYLARGTKVNLLHLEKRLLQTGHLPHGSSLDHTVLIGLLEERFSRVDFSRAAADVRPFIRNPEALSLWSPEFFISVTRDGLRT